MNLNTISYIGIDSLFQHIEMILQTKVITMGMRIESCGYTIPALIHIKYTTHYINRKQDSNPVAFIYQGHAIHTTYVGFNNKLNNYYNNHPIH